METSEIKTIRDLENYLAENSLPEVASIIQGAIAYFSDKCEKEDGKMDVKAKTERRNLGLKVELQDSSIVTHDVAQALKNWILSPTHGKYIGRIVYDDLPPLFSSNITTPRKEACEIIDYLRDRK